MKKLLAALMTLCLTVSLSACSVSLDTGEEPSQGSSSVPADGEFSGTTIEIAERFTGETSDVFAEIIRDFEAETGCKVTVTEYGDDYENTIKTRMASNSLPDIFETHGWSILRYKEYLLDLRDEPWVSDYDNSALGVIQDEDGSIYVLMVSELVNGTLVNLEVCEAAGVDPYEIKTWQQFTEACAKIKEAGYTPIGASIGAGTPANIAGTWVSYEGEQAEDSAAMLDGTYDWKSFRPFLDMYAEWLDNGYFFEDYATLKSDAAAERFAQNKSAFRPGNDPQFLTGCLQLNPEGQYAFLPSFASAEGGKLFVGVGEGEAFGIWKDSPNVEACKAFLEFMARPENVIKLTNVVGSNPCLKSAVELSDSYGLRLFMDMKEKCADDDILYENLWDRKYMPSGMWSVFDTAVQQFIADHSEAGKDSVLEYLRTNYQDLYEAAKAG